MKKWTWLAVATFGAAWAYLLVIFVLGEVVLGIRIKVSYLALTVVVSSVAMYRMLQWLGKRRLLSLTRLQNISLATMSSLLCLIAMDVVYTVYLNLYPLQRAPQLSREDDRRSDRFVWDCEICPRLFFPTQQNFFLHKPNVMGSGEHYGPFYSPELMASPTLANSVFQLKRVSFSIDEHGFRETTPLEQAEWFALGDSFTFGHGVEQEKAWVERLQEAIGTPIYNLGVNGLSPKQELMLLQYMLQQEKHPLRLRHLLWMIYEGNDLEDHYRTLRRVEKKKTLSVSDWFTGTIVEHLMLTPYVFKAEAVVNKFRTGRAKFVPPFKGENGAGSYLIDGVKLSHPVCHSSMHGYRFFWEPSLQRANAPQAYIHEHPNRPLLEQVFKDMASLAREFGFKVTVIIAPVDLRLYARYFEDCAPITDEPHFVNFVVNLSRQMGFDTINLVTLMQPYAQQELLYFRDDGHWNVRGNEVVAEIIAKYLVRGSSNSLSMPANSTVAPWTQRENWTRPSEKAPTQS